MGLKLSTKDILERYVNDDFRKYHKEAVRILSSDEYSNLGSVEIDKIALQVSLEKIRDKHQVYSEKNQRIVNYLKAVI